MIAFLLGPVVVACYGVAMALLLGVCLTRLHRAYVIALGFLKETSAWTLQVRNEDSFRLYRKSVADEAVAKGSFHSVWSEFLDEIHIRYNDEGSPLAESSTEALEKVKLELASVFERSHKVTRLCSIVLAVLGLIGAGCAVGAGSLSAVPFLEQSSPDAAKALATLFSAGGIAFVASAGGLFGAIAFRAVERWQQQRVEEGVDALANHLRGFVSFRGEPYYLAELTYTLRNERAGVKEFGQDLLDRVAQGTAATSLAAADTLARLQEHSHSLQALVALQEQRHSARDLLEDARAIVAIEKLAGATHDQAEAVRGLENSVQSLEIQMVNSLATASLAITAGEERIAGGVRMAMEQQTRDLRQALERIGLEFGAAMHVGARDLHSSLSSFSDKIARDLRGVHAVHFAEATVLARVTPQAAEELGAQTLREHNEPEGHVSDLVEETLAGPLAAIEEIPASLQVMIGCLDLLQSGHRGLGTIRSQLDYLRDTSDRVRHLLLDIQAAAVPIDLGAKDDQGAAVFPAWWNPQAARVVEALARIDEILVRVCEQALGYRPAAESALGEHFVQLGRTVEALWTDKNVPAILENLWCASRTPSQLVKGITSLKSELEPLCRSLIAAQRRALELEKELRRVWDVARTAQFTDDAFWATVEQRLAISLRTSRTLRSSRRRVQFPNALVESDVLPVLASLAKLVEETGFCVGKPARRKALGDKLPKAG